MSEMEVDSESDWDYTSHPGDCHPARDGGVWTVCCRECAGTGVFPVPWIQSPKEGRADMNACSCVRCKGTGQAVVGLAAADRDTALREAVAEVADLLDTDADEIEEIGAESQIKVDLQVGIRRMAAEKIRAALDQTKEGS